MTVVVIVGLLAGLTSARFGANTVSVAEGSGYARQVALALSMARRQAISEGVPAAVLLNRTAGAVTSVSVVRSTIAGDFIVDDPIETPLGVTTSAVSDRWEFDFSGALVTPLTGGSIQISAPGWAWTVTTFAATGHVRCEKSLDP